MKTIEKILYAGLGLVEETKGKLTEQFDVLVEKGKSTDTNNNYIITDFIKTIDDTKEKLGGSYNKKIEGLEVFLLNTLKSMKSSKETVMENETPE